MSQTPPPPIDSSTVGCVDQPWEQWHSAPLQVELGEEPAEAVVPLTGWLRELGIDGRPMIVDLFVTGTDQVGQEHHQRVAGASVRMEAEMHCRDMAITIGAIPNTFGGKPSTTIPLWTVINC